VVFQDLVAGRRQLRTVLLQAGEDREIALVDHLAAVALNVAVARGLFLRRATALLLLWAKEPVETVSDNKVSARRDLRIVILHFDGRIPTRTSHGHAGRDLLDGRRRVTQQRAEDKHCKMRLN
jgi:hypothetical protein